MYSDPIADMLTRIRNSYLAKHQQVILPHSTIKEAIAKVLKQYKYITDYKVISLDNHKKNLEVTLLYEKGKPAITKISRVSKAGRRVYQNKHNLPFVLSGLGIAIVTTSQGLMTARSARTKNLGGEIICRVW